MFFNRGTKGISRAQMMGEALTAFLGRFVMPKIASTPKRRKSTDFFPKPLTGEEFKRRKEILAHNAGINQRRAEHLAKRPYGLSKTARRHWDRAIRKARNLHERAPKPVEKLRTGANRRVGPMRGV